MSSSINHVENGCRAFRRASRKSMLRRHPIVTIAGGVLTGVAIVGVISMLPDIIRYAKIKSM